MSANVYRGRAGRFAISKKPERDLRYNILFVGAIMFWTAFTWGLGASLGASFGIMCYVALKCLWDWATNTKAAKRAAEISELSIAALDRRNDLTELQIDKLENIAVAMQHMNQER